MNIQPSGGGVGTAPKTGAVSDASGAQIPRTALPSGISAPESESAVETDMPPTSQSINPYEEITECNLADAAGDVSVAVHDYKSGYSIAGSDKKMKSASVIKLFVMEYAFSLIDKGEITADTLINGRSLAELMELMITVSDNNATNTLIEHFGMDKLNAYFAFAGYTGTVLGRKMLDFDALAKGKDNYTTSNDVMKFMDRLYASKDRGSSKQMLSIMKRQKVATKIRRDIPGDAEIANKTGELSDVENDVGIIFTPNGDCALVVLINNVTSPQSARDAIAATASDIFDFLKNGQ
ncbi:MAG: serine hydrolase [Oscillospiraceae bacterium]|nr:serine hydrolase [Oscillospiraceae bacterium]